MDRRSQGRIDRAPACGVLTGRLILGAFAVAVALAATSASGILALAARAALPSSPCIQEGLEPIPVTVRAGARYVFRTGKPEYEVRWSGRPLASNCDERRTVAAEVTVWFPHLRFSFSEGFPMPWQEFWNGRKAVHEERKQEADAPLFTGLECPFKARARLRYEVIASDGSVLGRRVEPAPVKLLPCPSRIRSKESPREA